jgi:hypothetical protein
LKATGYPVAAAAARGQGCEAVRRLAGGRAAVFHDGTVAFAHALGDAERRAGARLWKRRRRVGKLLTLARLAKGSATFAGGLDYLAWKISRHAGVPVTIKPWQRRFPLLGALCLLPGLLARRVVR